VYMHSMHAMAACSVHNCADNNVHLSAVLTLLLHQQFGFSTETLTEDMNTSLQMFRRGWRSAYVAEPNEVRHFNNFNNLNYHHVLA
jgi:cellulose synthase/poly-beta-1,6-N-acetylglucosamine synthase-like glycosyltransferase